MLTRTGDDAVLTHFSRFKNKEQIKSHYMWPESTRSIKLMDVFKKYSIEYVEEYLKGLFPSGEPVLCSSGRSAMVLALLTLKKNRQDLIGIFPYASHCVLDAVSRVATPLCGPTWKNTKLRIVYHQWSFVQEKELSANTIEDCVDTLCKPGTKLFPGGGDFELWSLPKILGTTSGGVLWCKDKLIARDIRKLRNEKRGAFINWILRLASKRIFPIYYCWNGVESNGGNLTVIQATEIYNKLLRWNEIYDLRTENIEKMWPFVNLELSRPQTRLPPVMPIKVEESIANLLKYHVSSGPRMFNYFVNEKSTFVKVLPIPVHQDVSTNWLDEVISCL